MNIYVYIFEVAKHCEKQCTSAKLLRFVSTRQFDMEDLEATCSQIITSLISVLQWKNTYTPLVKLPCRHKPQSSSISLLERYSTMIVATVFDKTNCRINLNIGGEVRDRPSLDRNTYKGVFYSKIFIPV